MYIYNTYGKKIHVLNTTNKILNYEIYIYWKKYTDIIDKVIHIILILLIKINVLFIYIYILNYRLNLHRSNYRLYWYDNILLYYIILYYILLYWILYNIIQI